MNRTGMIITGGSIKEPFVLQQIKEKEPKYLIAVDRGLLFFYQNQILPTHIVGDFDSVPKEVIAYYREHTDIEIRTFHPVKDASDTEIGLRLALEIGAEEIWLLGATGTRLDHVMANMQILKIALDAKVKAYMLDSHNQISLHDKNIILDKEKQYGSYFSIFPLGGIVEEVTIRGAKYPLEKYRLCPYDSLCVSNEVQDEKVEITFSNGMLLLMETRD